MFRKMDKHNKSSKLKNYFGKEIFMLKFTGISIEGNESRAYNIYSKFCLSLVFGYPIVAFSDLFKHDFDVVSDLLIYELATMMVCCEVIVTLINKKKLKQLLNKLEEAPYAVNLERGGEVEEKLIKGCISFTTKQAIICWASVFVTVGMATVATLLKRIKSSDPNNWEFTYGPLTIINITYSPNYEIVWLYQILCTSTIGLNHCSINLVTAGILAHSSVQFKMLQNNLSRIVENSRRLAITSDVGTSIKENIESSAINWKYLKKALDEALQYHIKILEITTEVEEIFTMLTLSIFVFSFGVLCFLVYHASLLQLNDMRFVKVFTDSTTALFPVLLLCYWSQEMSFESEEVARSAFEADFVGTDLKFQKGLCLITSRSQRPVQLKAGKLIEISLPTFVSIVRTSYSAFMVLRNVNMK